MAIFWAPMVAITALVAWWLFASRLRWSDRVLVPLACAAAGVASFFLWDGSLRTIFGVIFGVNMYALPAVSTGWVVALMATSRFGWPIQRASLLAAFVLTWGAFGLVRLEGVDGNLRGTLSFRWVPTAEERFLAESSAMDAKRAAMTDSIAPASLVLADGDWPSFRGPNRDGRYVGARIAGDWAAKPPRPIWRKRVGPGWSSFAVVGNRIFTQEQRGENEVVVCYSADTGAEVWTHADDERFSEVVAGPGPRATPTFHDGKIYALGAAGRLNCLDAATGSALWSRDIVADTQAKTPMWGFAASPLVAADVVTVFAGGPDGKSVIGYDAQTGELAWTAGDGQFSYGSTQPARVEGVEQLVIASEAGLSAFDPAAGGVLWRHDWPLEGARIVQPTLVDAADFLLGTGLGFGTRRVHVARTSDGWTTSEVWTTRAIKPYFNDLVVDKKHLYGFDGSILTCVSLEDGKATWKARGYGNGQLLLLANQSLLLVLSEQGEAALVEARADEHKELGRFQAIEGKTWNHPVVAHGKLFVRNGEEAACYQLAPDGAEAFVAR